MTGMEPYLARSSTSFWAIGADHDAVQIAAKARARCPAPARRGQSADRAAERNSALAAQLVHARLKGHARAGGGLLKDHAQRLALERADARCRASFRISVGRARLRISVISCALMIAQFQQMLHVSIAPPSMISSACSQFAPSVMLSAGSSRILSFAVRHQDALFHGSPRTTSPAGFSVGMPSISPRPVTRAHAADGLQAGDVVARFCARRPKAAPRRCA